MAVVRRARADVHHLALERGDLDLLDGHPADGLGDGSAFAHEGLTRHSLPLGMGSGDLGFRRRHQLPLPVYPNLGTRTGVRRGIL
jgi:hypothetical protein